MWVCGVCVCVCVCHCYTTEIIRLSICQRNSLIVYRIQYIQYSTLQYSTYSTVQYITVHTVQYSSVQYSTVYTIQYYIHYVYGPTEGIGRIKFSFTGGENNLLTFQSLTAKTAPAAQDHVPATKQTGLLTMPYQ
jgi:hypothetical protein